MSGLKEEGDYTNYYISDVHLFHKNVTSEGSNFDNRQLKQTGIIQLPMLIMFISLVI